jgi:hypothetical protein
MAGKPQLRNALKKLRRVEARIEGEFDRVETGQEMLDLLAVLDGLKPVFLHGRGLDDPAWIAGVVEIARGLGLRIIQGPCWNPLPPDETFPRWYVECIAAEIAPHRPFYICKAPVIVREVEEICAAGGRPTIEQEAALLGYPECCVAAHHAQMAAYHRYVIARIEEMAAGDVAQARTLYGAEIDLAPRTDDEQDILDFALDIVPCPFGSWDACPQCQEEDDGPSAELSDDYQALAVEVDEGLYDLLLPAEGDD